MAGVSSFLSPSLPPSLPSSACLFVCLFLCLVSSYTACDACRLMHHHFATAALPPSPPPPPPPWVSRSLCPRGVNTGERFEGVSCAGPLRQVASSHRTPSTCSPAKVRRRGQRVLCSRGSLAPLHLCSSPPTLPSPHTRTLPSFLIPPPSPLRYLSKKPKTSCFVPWTGLHDKVPADLLSRWQTS